MTASSDSPDTRIGPYRLLSELGRGGQAIVWLAEDTRLVRRVALKVLPHLGPGAEVVLRRFRREAEAAARLDHPAICPIYEADVEEGVPFLAMRYVEGETLARKIAAERDQGSGPHAVALRAGAHGDAEGWRAIATFFEKAARALHAAHEAGIVHRDIKPANLMVTPDGEPVILDFGLARQDLPESAALSLTAEHSGTPAYMSPEQITGRLRPDRQSDVYSLGCALFETLTARHPFQAATLEGLFHAVLHEEPTNVRSVHPAVQKDLAVIVATAIEKDRERRYKSALDLAEDLARFVRDEPILARPVRWPERARRWAQRKPALAGSLLAIVLLLIAATGLLSYGIGASGRAELQAELRRQADRARDQMVQVARDRELAGELDELQMRLGTLLFGTPGGAEILPGLVPEYLRAFAGAGLDLSREDALPKVRAALAELGERDPNAWRTVLDALRNLRGLLADRTGPTWQNLTALLAEHADPWRADIAAVERRWEVAKEDGFAPYLEQDALRALSPDQLGDLAGALMDVTGREDQVLELLDRAIRLRPDSFPLHYMRGGMSIQRASSSAPGDRATELAAAAVRHFQAAAALRPRSGLARAMLASAMAVEASLTRRFAQFGPAREVLESATEVEPSSALVWFMKADYLRRGPDRDDAIAACKKALELDPSMAPARRLLEELSAPAER